MINEVITTVLDYINQISGGNQMVAGAISMWALGTVTFLLRGVPMAIWGFIKRFSTTSLTMNNGGYAQEEMVGNFMTWLHPRISSNMSRTLSVIPNSYPALNGSDDEDEKESKNLGIGYGVHFFFYNKRLFWIHKAKLESSGSERQKEEITVSTIGRSFEPFKKLVNDFTPKKKDNEFKVYRATLHGDWEMMEGVPKRYLNSIALSEDIKKQLKDQISHFKNNREWFYDKGVAYKLSYIIHGVPGSGKTSLIKALACEFGMDICIININQMSDGQIEALLSQTPKNSAVIIEDIDSSPATKSRGDAQRVKGGKKQESNDNSDPFSSLQTLTLTGILNTLDGIVPLDDCVLFMTTNHVDKLDPAIYRKGRVDHTLEINEVDAESVRTYVQRTYPESNFDNIEFKETLGCYLNQALLEAKEDSEKFIDSLIENNCAERKK